MDTENIHGFVESLNSSIADLKAEIEPVLSTLLEDKISHCELVLDQIKIYNSHLYCVISILYCYIKVLGVNTDEHPIMKELTRIKQVMKSVKEVEESLKNKDEKDLKSQEQAKEFLQRTLGTKVGAAVTENMKSPAISSANFKGTHTKFKDEEWETSEKPKPYIAASGSKSGNASRSKATKATTKSNSKPSGKVTKPKNGRR
ncbi:CIC11C00000005467 [Sungouiella intermedia]|uniref:Exosome complex protein n=1 Tax=Sungouiella intermedia TaxID=45354 RepID=A0A1L0B9V3_9ASCO|nr:CIC11C00000005467 [[Candida] intermedia]